MSFAALALVEIISTGSYGAGLALSVPTAIFLEFCPIYIPKLVHRSVAKILPILKEIDLITDLIEEIPIVCHMSS